MNDQSSNNQQHYNPTLSITTPVILLTELPNVPLNQISDTIYNTFLQYS